MTWMHGYQLADHNGEVDLSVAMTGELDRALGQHLDKGPKQEDLTFAYWKASRGAHRYTGVLQRLNLPRNGERILQGNVAFTSDYLTRVLAERPADCGVALLHSHLGPGWQGMSEDDEVAERDRLGGLVASASGLPVLGLTRGTDGAWSGRFWFRSGRHKYERRWASTVRSVGRHLRITYHPELRRRPSTPTSQAATISVWGKRAQEDLARARVGIVGLGSVGSIVAETLSRTGLQQLMLIDHDHIEERNLDRTLGAYPADIPKKLLKVEIAKRLVDASHTSARFSAIAINDGVHGKTGLANALDCDALLSCVDRPWPRHILNVLAYAHLIPVVDGGILVRVHDDRLLHVDWRVHTVGPEHACLYCLDAMRRSDVALDRDGLLDDPDYLKGLSQAERERYGRRNVFAFSLSVASHQVLQLVGLITGNERVGGRGPQTYHAYPGVMEIRDTSSCLPDCDIQPLTAIAHENIL
ncbi:MAG TPA: ThiF family adenylyltransferase [Burkholderiales bacterium]|nr:ThiF family adenylyltransferase [Burkholderiales bacterium]